jgi:hypothetical protein
MLSDVLKGFSGGGVASLLAWLLPSGIAVGAFAFLVFPHIDHLPILSDIAAASKDNRALVVGAATVTIALLQNALSTPLYRILEGYYWPDKLRTIGVDRQKARRARLERRAENLPEVGWRKYLYLERVMRYPLNADETTPTQLGNAIRAFETYAADRYNMDSQTLWTELYTVIPEALRKEHDQARANVDVFISFVTVSLLFACISIATGFLAGPAPKPPHTPLILLGSVVLVSMAGWYKAAVASTSYWSATVQAMVNLGRTDLAMKLGLQVPTTLEDERNMWAYASLFVAEPYTDEAGSPLNEFRIRKSMPGEEG